MNNIQAISIAKQLNISIDYTNPKKSIKKAIKKGLDITNIDINKIIDISDYDKYLHASFS